MSVAGFEDKRDKALTSKRVVRTRLSVRSCLRATVQRASAIGAPARLIIASAPSMACSHGPVSRAFHGIGFTFTPGCRTSWSACLVRILTRWPPWKSAVHNARPMNPVPPVTTIFIPCVSCSRTGKKWPSLGHTSYRLVRRRETRTETVSRHAVVAPQVRNPSAMKETTIIFIIRPPL